jgi:Flp pilus assembly protein TadB
MDTAQKRELKEQRRKLKELEAGQQVAAERNYTWLRWGLLAVAGLLVVLVCLRVLEPVMLVLAGLIVFFAFLIFGRR